MACFGRYDRKLLDVNGELTILGAKKERQQKEREYAKKWQADREVLTGSLKKSPGLLKVLQTEAPETTKAVWCNELKFFSCEAACFHRMFILEGPDQACVGCHQHDARFDWLKGFLGAKDGQKS